MTHLNIYTLFFYLGSFRTIFISGKVQKQFIVNSDAFLKATLRLYATIAMTHTVHLNRVFLYAVYVRVSKGKQHKSLFSLSLSFCTRIS